LAPAPAPNPAPHRAETVQETDIFAKIERLADLHQKGILSPEEFTAKKAELLSRLSAHYSGVASYPRLERAF
jgi:Short C-terminal domain